MYLLTDEKAGYRSLPGATFGNETALHRYIDYLIEPQLDDMVNELRVMMTKPYAPDNNLSSKYIRAIIRILNDEPIEVVAYQLLRSDLKIWKLIEV